MGEAMTFFRGRKVFVGKYLRVYFFFFLGVGILFLMWIWGVSLFRMISC
jgi:hypothetical protein